MKAQRMIRQAVRQSEADHEVLLVRHFCSHRPQLLLPFNPLLQLAICTGLIPGDAIRSCSLKSGFHNLFYRNTSMA